MTEIDSALSDIARIRDQMAASTRFQSFTPAIVAGTGLLALALAALQDHAPELLQSGRLFAAQWILLAIISALLIGTDAVVRARKLHGGLADRLLNTTLRQFLPASLGGGVCAIIIMSRAPQAAWMLPGLWQLLMGIGIFASLATLPRSFAVSAFWYLGAGTVTLAWSAGSAQMSPWAMGLPFGLGQLLVAGLIAHMIRSGRDV